MQMALGSRWMISRITTSLIKNDFALNLRRPNGFLVHPTGGCAQATSTSLERKRSWRPSFKNITDDRGCSRRAHVTFQAEYNRTFWSHVDVAIKKAEFKDCRGARRDLGLMQHAC